VEEQIDQEMLEACMEQVQEESTKVEDVKQANDEKIEDDSSE
jgi:hypothetical protein